MAITAYRIDRGWNKMKRKYIVILGILLLGACLLGWQIFVHTFNQTSNNLYERGFAGYTSDEEEVLSSEYYSSKSISVSQGDVLYFGPCEPGQNFQLVGFSGDKAVTGKVRGRDLAIVDTFENNLVIYSYKVTSGVNRVVFTNAASVEPVYVVSRTKFTDLGFRAYWKDKGVNVSSYVGESSYYAVSAGDKLYFGAVTEGFAILSKLYDDSGEEIGSISKADLTLVENFGGKFNIYCYTVPASKNIYYVHIAYDPKYKDYYKYIKVGSGESMSKEQIVGQFIDSFGAAKAGQGTIDKLSGRSALFLGDSITYGARDKANIYGSGGWAGRIGYYCGMKVLNNGVSGACISTSRIAGSGTDRYIYNNLVKAKDQKFDYIVMHSLFNDANDRVAMGTPQGAVCFDPGKADVSKFSDALENLFYTAKKLYPNATYGYIINFRTERSVNLQPYVDAAKVICDDWGVPYLDLYNREGFNVDLDVGLHPSSAGYDSMYNIVADWMASLK
jgi:lysophospholipase L1-like esterase